jgi:hypothetical protein
MKKIAIGFLLGILSMMLVLCSSGYNPSNPNNIQKTRADLVNFNKYNGKTIKNVQFINYPSNVTGCHDMVITFTDGTELRMYIYKYIPEIKN